MACRTCVRLPPLDRSATCGRGDRPLTRRLHRTRSPGARSRSAMATSSRAAIRKQAGRAGASAVHEAYYRRGETGVRLSSAEPPLALQSCSRMPKKPATKIARLPAKAPAEPHARPQPPALVTELERRPPSTTSLAWPTFRRRPFRASSTSRRSFGKKRVRASRRSSSASASRPIRRRAHSRSGARS